MKLSHSAEDCIAAFKTLAATGTVTRDRYRKDSGITESVWTYHFGTFAELKRQAGHAPVATVNKLHTAVAKATAAKRFDPLNKERAEYAEAYVRSDNGRYKTMIVASDLHDREIDPFYLRVLRETAERIQPDVISFGGDIFDLPEFGRYTIDPREWDAVGRIKYVHSEIFEPIRNACPDAQIDLIEGNHECVALNTEVLTEHGWIEARLLTPESRVASFQLDTHDISYLEPVALARQSNRSIYEVSTLFKRELVTENHRLIYDGKLQALETLGDKLDGRNFLNALSCETEDEIIMEPNLVRLMIWIITHGVIRHDSDSGDYWISFKVPRRIERRIKSVVQDISGLTWVKVHKGIEVIGANRLPLILEIITGQKSLVDCTKWTELPDWFERLPLEYGKLVATELTWASTQQFMAKHTSYYNGYMHDLGDALQWFLVRRNVPCAINKLPMNQYILVFNETGTFDMGRGRRVDIKQWPHGEKYDVVSIQTHNGTLITRVGGRINFTGNCRLIKHLADFSPATRAILGDLHGMTIGDLFGLGKYEINYIAKADLKSYTERDHRKELQNNYKVYYDSVMVHHFPHARHMGLPGLNGHHHSHVVWPMYNVHCGSYEWHQLGSGHRRKASYCEGEQWHNGFAIVHVDTLTKTVNIEYIPVTTMAIVGGKFYTRQPSEIIT